jgi:glycosyltransferase involved in cell wall biosynthesis
VGEAKRRAGKPSRRATVAVAIPTIPGREALFERAMASVRAQRRFPDQVVVEYDAERTGAAAARNRALERVTTDFVAWLDDDDELLPHHLMACMRVLEMDRSLDLVYPAPKMIGGPDPTAVTYQGQLTSPWGVRFRREQEAHLRRQGSFIPMTHIVRTELAKSIGGFRDGYHLEDGRYRGEDEDYLIRLLDAGGTFEHLDRVTWRWYSHPQTSTAGRPDRGR